MSLITLALIVSLAAVLAAVAFVVSRALTLFRDTRGFTRALGDQLEALADAVERLSTKEPPDLERLSTSLARLEADRRRLEILTGALRRVQQQWGGLLAVYPRK